MQGARFSLDTLSRQYPGRTLRSIGLCAGYSRNVMQHVRQKGWLSTEQADRIAISLGVHPADIWGAQWWDSATDEPRCAHCGEPAPFARRATDERSWCSSTCRHAGNRTLWKARASRSRAAKRAA